MNAPCRLFKKGYAFLHLVFPFILCGILLLSGSGGAARGEEVALAERGSPLAGAPAFRQVAVHLDGMPLQFDVAPHMQQGNPVFPLRRIFEEMGYKVHWEVENKRIVLTGWGRYIILYPQNPLYSINGVVYRMSVPPFLEKGRLMVGLDFIQQAAGVSSLSWDEAEDVLEIRFKEGRRFWGPQDLPEPGISGEYPTRFLEVLLPTENRVGVGESFEIEIGAPFVAGIHSYEVRFFYNPELIKIKDIKNPSYRKAKEFYMKNINNREGVVEYTQTNLGVDDDIPPRRTMVIVEGIAFREGAVPLIKETLHVTVFDNAAKNIPVALEEKTLYIRSAH